MVFRNSRGHVRIQVRYKVFHWKDAQGQRLCGREVVLWDFVSCCSLVVLVFEVSAFHY